MKTIITAFTMTILSCALLNAGPAAAQTATPAMPNGTENRSAGFTFRIIPAANHTFGYEILRNGKLFIRQLTRNGMQGIEGFKDKVAATRVAMFVIAKLHKGESLPTISKQELDSLHAM